MKCSSGERDIIVLYTSGFHEHGFRSELGQHDFDSRAASSDCKHLKYVEHSCRNCCRHGGFGAMRFASDQSYIHSAVTTSL
jgi:hypothetical protein